MTMHDISAEPLDPSTKIAALGPVFSPEVLEQTAALYESLVSNREAEGIRIHQDIVYGPHSRHRLDVFAPDGGSERPVLVFIHGGGFVSGDKSISGSFYRNIGLWFAGRGIVTVTANYRLAPAFNWPAGPEDVGSIVGWIEEHIKSFGGEPGKIFLFGHSAGACHVASYLFAGHRRMMRVAGGVLVSGVYRAFGDDIGPEIALYFGDDAESRRINSPLSQAGRNTYPLLIALAEFDPAWIAAHSLDLANALTVSKGSCPRFAWFKGHNHVSTVFSFGSGETLVGDAILEFMRDTLAGG